jgi:UDP-N-acetylmuramoyl-L-alanyl-D-glutamate--2,6-diaminopimelate ligase
VWAVASVTRVTPATSGLRPFSETPCIRNLADILPSVTGLREVRGTRDRSFGELRYDSRAVSRGDVYVAVNGRDDRALEYVGAAVARGATTIVVDEPGRLDEAALRGANLTVVVVDDARVAMAEMANALHDHPSRRLRLFGVTGTNGKTTTTYVLRQLLQAVGEKVGVIGTLGMMIDEIIPTGYTTPESPELVQILDRMASAGCGAVAMEVSSHALALHRVDGLSFAGAIFTNLTQDHLDFHDSIQSYRDAKKLLFDRLDADRPAVVNVDDVHGRAMVRDSYARVHWFGSAAEADALVAGVRLDAGGSSWTLTLGESLGGGSLELRTPLLGAFNVWNITAALTLALAAGYDRERLVAAVATLHPVPGRMESISLANGITAVVDYAHTPDALDNVLSTLQELRGASGIIIAVFGCGGDRDRSKRPQMGAIAARRADRVIVTSDNPRSEDPATIIEEILAGIDDRSRVESIIDRDEAIAHALDGARDGDIVLVAGKGHETYQIIGTERRHFDDREVVREWSAAAA